MKINTTLETQYDISEEGYILIDSVSGSTEVLKGFIDKITITSVQSREGLNPNSKVGYTIKITLPPMYKDSTFYINGDDFYKNVDDALKNIGYKAP